MLFMVIETFRDNDMIPVYERLRERGRMLPTGVTFVDSWVEVSLGRCFQLMECEDAAAMQDWVLQWRGTGVSFEFIPVVPGATTKQLVEPSLGSGS